MKAKKVTVGILMMGLMSAPLTSCSSDGATTQVQGTALGAIGGAVLGGAIGLATGGNSKSVIAGAVAGGVIGAAAGLAWANSIVKEKAAYANMEDYVNDNIKQLDSRTSEAKKTNAKLSEKVASLKAQNKKLSAKETKQLTTNLALIDTDISTARDAMAEASSAQKKELETKVKTLQAERETLASLCSI